MAIERLADEQGTLRDSKTKKLVGSTGSGRNNIPTSESVLAKATTPNSIQENGVNMKEAYNIYRDNIKPEGKAKILSYEEYENVLLGFGIDKILAEKAAYVLSSNPPLLIATSGKLASGKDTIALEFVKALGVNDQHHLSFAAPLKDEAQEVLDAIRASASPTEAIEKIMEFNVPRDRAEYIVEVAYEGAHKIGRAHV